MPSPVPVGGIRMSVTTTSGSTSSTSASRSSYVAQAPTMVRSCSASSNRETFAEIAVVGDHYAPARRGRLTTACRQGATTTPETPVGSVARLVLGS
jgi:hypothetical protein